MSTPEMQEKYDRRFRRSSAGTASSAGILPSSGRTTWVPKSSRWWMTTTSRSEAGGEPDGWAGGGGELLRNGLPAFDPVGATNHPATVASRFSAATDSQAGLFEEATKRMRRTCRRISGTAIRTLTRSAAWSTPRNAILTRLFSRWPPIRWGRSIHKTLSCGPNCYGIT